MDTETDQGQTDRMMRRDCRWLLRGLELID